MSVTLLRQTAGRKASLAAFERILSPLLARFAARADESDRMRDVPAESVAELRGSGLLRLYQPTRCGGAINLASPVTRTWLDLSAARAHIGNDPTLSLSMAGAALRHE